MAPALRRGSEWRKWDLHVHSPASALNNQFPCLPNGEPDWEAYVTRLESLGDISALGVTDYFTIEGYRKLREYRNVGRLGNLGLVIPNIEFRLDKLVGTAGGHRRLNYHVIFSQDVSPDEIDEHFLQEIKFRFEADPQREDLSWSIRRTNLELLGRRLKEEHARFDDGRSDFEIGCMNATVDASRMKEVLRDKERVFKGKYLIVLVEEHLSLLQWDGQDHHTRKLLLQGADAIFSGSPSTIAWARGEGDLNPEQFRREFKTLKPCLHGSDAHKLEDIGQPAENRYCWIKADLTFEGLKQVLYEPRARLAIAEKPPVFKNDYQVVESIKVDGVPDWFRPEEIILNQDLVAIIGPRGSGKSALAEMIAFAGGAKFFGPSEDVRDTFLFKASKRSIANPTPITGATLSMKWRDGQVDRVQVPSTLQHGREEEKVKYLPQRFVERLCAPENNRQLEEEIERVIFQRIDKTERMDASNFGELRQTATKSLGVKRNKLGRTIQDLNQDISDASARIAVKPTKEHELKRKREELQALLKIEPQVPQENKDELERLAILTKLKEQLEGQIVDCNEQLNTLDTIQTKIDLLKDDIRSFNREIQELLERVGLREESATFLVHVPSEVAGVLTRRRSELDKTVGELRKGVIGDVETPSLDKFNSEIEAIRIASRLSETKKKEQEKFQRDRKQLEESITSIEREIKEITELVVPRQKDQDETRIERYLDAFELIKEERTILERLYAPLRASLLSSNETARKLEFVSRPTFDVVRHAVRGMELLDRRKALYGDVQELERNLKEFFDQVVDANFDRAKIKELLHLLHESFVVQGEKKLTIAEQLRKERTTKEFADWFYGIEDFSVTYSIKFDAKDLHLLSPGEKGVVLLLLYLEAENQDNRPLIIDQPDDNLDNVSVYPSLTEYFRTRKRTRQIIIITHNPNLVVNTDAEQVFVADFDGSRNPRIVYRSGPLEDNNAEGGVPGIREEVCKILEGGTVAFQLREQRYALP